MWQLQDFDPTAFIEQYWQKKPCVIRQALVNFESPITPEELAGLACEDDVHCRLVLERGGSKPWEVRYGPFEEKEFTELASSHYALLVSECEKWIPELKGLLDQFRFIPDWRIDDLMLSYAPADGSVGPHVDEYDVFLLQAMGKRRWQFGSTPLQNPQFVPGLELAIISNFEPDQDVVLNPGDILYLPPGFAHHGIALEPCMTYSIGFRAPTAATALESFALEIERLGTRVDRYRDTDLELERHHSEITDTEIDRFRDLATELLTQAGGLWQEAIGKMLTESAVAPSDPAEQPIYVSDLQACGWMRHPDTRLLFYRSAQYIRVFYNGRVHDLPTAADVLEHLQQLCDHHEWPPSLMNACIEIEPMKQLLLVLATENAILPIQE